MESKLDDFEREGGRIVEKWEDVPIVLGWFLLDGKFSSTPYVLVLGI
jgi:hypothetical protein